MQVSRGSIVRTVILLIALLNSIFVQFGLEAIPLEDEQIKNVGVLFYELGSHVFLIVSALVAWWKNNSFTKSAIQADLYLKKVKDTKK